MNGLFRMHLTQITNSVRPSLAEINDKFFEAAERYSNHKNLKTRSPINGDRNKNPQSDKNKVSTYKSSSSFAVGVGFSKRNSFKPCTLCSHEEKKEASHPIFKCEKFSSPQAKLDKINLLKGCVRCSNLNHVAEKCQFRFNNRCKHCKEWHFSFLCIPRESEEESSKTRSKQSTSNLSVVEALRVSAEDDNSILPTFSCGVKGRMIRCLKDGGCQSNLISESLVDQLNLKILEDNVKLKIKGINVSHEYSSKLVEIDLFFGKDR